MRRHEEADEDQDRDQPRDRYSRHRRAFRSTPRGAEGFTRTRNRKNGSWDEAAYAPE